MTWATYSLLRHAQALQAMRKELGEHFSMSEDKISVNWDILNSGALPFTLAIFYETLRLYPPVPIELKECTKPSIFPDGTALPQDTVVMWIPWAMGRSKRIWGDDADAFKPERWLETNDRGIETVISKTAYEFPVFNGGPRTCLGKKMAELLGVKIISSMLWRYNFKEVEVGADRKSQNSLTLPMEGGLPCIVSFNDKRRQS